MALFFKEGVYVKNKIKPDYVARKSIWPAFKLRRLLVIAIAVVAFFFVDEIQTAIKGFVELDATIIKIILGAIAAIPVLAIIIHIVILANIKIEFYESSSIDKKGVFNRKQNSAVFMGVLSATVEKKFWGDIFNYGDVTIKNLGKLNIDTRRIARPVALQEYLKTRFLNQPSINVMLPIK